MAFDSNVTIVSTQPKIFTIVVVVVVVVVDLVLSQASAGQNDSIAAYHPREGY